jgi:hypothetical protein
MFWNDIADIKEWMVTISSRLTDLQFKMDGVVQQQEDQKQFVGHHLAVIKDFLIDVLDIDVHDEIAHNSLSLMHQKLNDLLSDHRRREEVELATKTLDKFRDYMKNVDKLNGMINEFKGCVSIARASFEERKKIAQKDLEYNLAVMTAANILKDETQSKIDYIYENMAKIAQKMQNCEKKSRKP